MSIDIRLPNITGGSATEQLAQMKSYLQQLTQQLNWALNTIDSQQENIRQEALRQGEALPGPGDTFNSIKSLIIKSAEIVDAYCEQISRRLDGQYVAQSAFGTYQEEVSQTITESAKGIEQLFTDMQEISNTVNGIAEQSKNTNAYIRTGLLGYDDNGFPIYGMEVGQENSEEGAVVFHRFARFCADRVSFFDNNDTEVAYISNYRLYITDAQIAGGITIAGYRLDGSDGLAFIWEGD